MIHFYSQIPCNLGWSVLGFTSVSLYQILNRYSKLFGIMTESIIIILLFLLLLLLSLLLLLEKNKYDKNPIQIGKRQLDFIRLNHNSFNLNKLSKDTAFMFTFAPFSSVKLTASKNF